MGGSGRVYIEPRTAGGPVKNALQGFDEQPRLTRMLTASKSPVVGSAITLARALKVPKNY